MFIECAKCVWCAGFMECANFIGVCKECAKNIKSVRMRKEYAENVEKKPKRRGKNVYCRKITLENYRNIEKAEINFTSGVNVLFGANAQGKTNVLESIYSFAKGKSFRNAPDREIATIGQNSYFSSLEFVTNDRTHTLSTRYYEGEKLRLHNGIKIERLFEMIGRFRAVFFCPEHLALVKGGAGERRSLLNIALSQSKAGYIRQLAAYNRILANRNALLRTGLRTGKSGTKAKAQIDVWSLSLAPYAADIFLAREKYITRLEYFMNFFIKEMTKGKEQISLRYRSDLSDSEDKEQTKEKIVEKYIKTLTTNIEKEINTGATLYGIHRDDIIIKLNGISARNFTSQGQQRSIALAIKLAEGEISKEMMGEYPVFLFDDVLSELDVSRRAFMLNALTDRQIIITACERSLFESAKNAGEIKLVKVENGRFTEL